MFYVRRCCDINPNAVFVSGRVLLLPEINLSDIMQSKSNCDHVLVGYNKLHVIAHPP